MRGNSESINKPLSAALLDGVGQRRRRYVETCRLQTGYHRRRLAFCAERCMQAIAQAMHDGDADVRT